MIDLDRLDRDIRLLERRGQLAWHLFFLPLWATSAAFIAYLALMILGAVACLSSGIYFVGIVAFYALVAAIGWRRYLRTQRAPRIPRPPTPFPVLSRFRGQA